jgi:A/G-specific adenine glycosylase
VDATEANFARYRRTLLAWWVENTRDYPWRQRRSPYRVAIAEIMLRRTRADQVVAVYRSFLDAFPTLEDAAAADPARIRSMLWSLGLAWRADTLVTFLKEARARFHDQLPTDPSVLRTLTGVGDYVAAAIACFSANLPVALLDTNIVRVLGRIFGVDIRGEARRRRSMRELAERALDATRPADYHYAVLDFGARICVATNPRCEICPFSVDGLCDYYQARARSEALPGDTTEN